MTSPSQPVTDPLDLVALDTERFVASAGWDQNPRLFALVPTEELLAAEPHLRSGMSVSDFVAGALTAIEQEDLPQAGSVEELLRRITWPDSVAGCAIALERIVLPPDAERDLPEDPEAALAHLNAHPERQDVRLLVAVSRAGGATCLIRQRAHDSDDRVARGSDLAPGVVAALRLTLED